MKPLKSFWPAAAVFLLAASNMASAQAKPPVLTIGGKESPDVYLQSLDIQVEVTGNIASTRYTMVFKNKTNRVLEGELTFPLPDGRSVTHYALDINGKMREAVPVEKAKGTQVFEEIQRRRVDPGLLERVEGNNMRTRVYPIPANGQRTVSIGYEEELALEKNMLYYRLPMAYPNALENFAVKATVWKGGQKPHVPQGGDEIRFDLAGENYVASLARKNYRPSRALVFALPAPDDIPRVMMQSAQGSYYFLASVAPKTETRKKQWADELAVIWDVSLSGSQRNLKREIEMLNTIFAEKKNATVHLYLLNNKLAKKGEYKAEGGKWDALKKVLETAVFDGGTDFSKIDLNNIAGKEVLFFSDGISTLSDADFIKDAKASRPIHCVVSSAKADYSVMKLIAGKTKGKFINVNALSAEKLKGELLNETLMFLGAEYGKAVREVYPGIAAPVYGNFSIAGLADTNYAELTLLFGFGGAVEKRFMIQLDAKNAASGGNAHKIWAQKKIAELDLDYEKNRGELMELGQQFGIVTRNTSLIVLETVSDYITYKIEPPASEPELRAEYRRKTDGAEKRTAAIVESAPPSGAPRQQPAKPASAPPQSGQARSGGGSASNKSRSFAFEANEVIGYLDNPTPVYIIDMDDPNADPLYLDRSFRDALKENADKDAMGRVSKGGELKVSSPDFMSAGARIPRRSIDSVQSDIMRNMPTLNYAYERRCRNVPGLAGTVTVKFVISEFGEVIYARATGSTINDSTIENNVVNGVVNWRFSSVNLPDDTMEVVHPFTFSGCPGDPSSRPKGETKETKARIARGIVGKNAELEKAAAAARERKKAAALDARLFGAATAADNLKKWWDTDFEVTPQKPKYPVPDGAGGAGGAAGADSAKGGAPKAAEYLGKMTGKAADDYQIYLKARNGYASAPAFYFDMADWFYKLGDKETALCVLTSIADLELENASLYRLLGYRFKEYGEYALEKFVCRKVVEWRPIEPQSYRDYALALADNGDAQAALDSLYAMLARPYSESIRGRARGIEEIAVTEINRLIAKNPKLNASKVDKRLRVSIPVDVRVVINWNMDNTDIDLHVEDPNGEMCYYRHRETKIGGRMSKDITGGYGPEQFLLKRAVKGKYRVYVNYFSDSRFKNDGPSTVMAEVYTKYADKTEKRQVVSLQMSNAKRDGDGKVLVAEFEF